ncbi:PP2C family protein-serine/threonine phosphatase [Streptomyces sp. SCSIO ZS0520]|uniref:PP2C family protein-serine/threonine phosphatase n=1 Tax=Streptomyces sp. SCSIO ZS0520 TaxID=2892996 RepID=UPI0021DB480E|nr:PP2C family protein-serine/threonine phosphatase [Streptomyces sp. SCSIO ZS0520]
MERFSAVERALRGAAPDTLPDVLREQLRARYAATDGELLMGDYSMTRLQPVGGGPGTAPLPMHSGPAGRAFGAQEAQTVLTTSPALAEVHLPVTVHGDRLGVLSVTLPVERYSEEIRDELQEVAEALGHQIVVAERHTDRYVRARRADRLTLAAEIQWELLPGRSHSHPVFDLGAQLEPAYSIHGDNFDWTTSDGRLTLTVTNGMGEGIEAALLTSLAVNALRNARRAGLDLVGQANLADQALYGQHRGERHVSALLLRFALADGRAEVVDAGSPRMWRLREGRVEPVELDAQLPLGMFEDTVYAVQRFQVAPGDRLVFVSDGVYDAGSPLGERFSDRALTRALTRSRLLPPSQVPYAVLREVADHRGEADAEDDAMVVCLDWHGTQGGAGRAEPATS